MGRIGPVLMVQNWLYVRVGMMYTNFGTMIVALGV
jgi:hypothetical protein